MITIRHYPKKQSIAYGDCPFNQTLCNQIGEDAINGCPLCDPYAKGKKPATYPMPAIRLSVIIDANFTCIFDTTNKTCVFAVEQPGYVPFGDGLY